MNVFAIVLGVAAVAGWPTYVSTLCFLPMMKGILNGVADHSWSRILWDWLGSRLRYSDWYHLRDNWTAGRV